MLNYGVSVFIPFRPSNSKIKCSLGFLPTNSLFMTSNLALSMNSHFGPVSHDLKIDSQISYCLSQCQRIIPVIWALINSNFILVSIETFVSFQADIILSKSHTCSFSYCEPILWETRLYPDEYTISNTKSTITTISSKIKWTFLHHFMNPYGTIQLNTFMVTTILW